VEGRIPSGSERFVFELGVGPTPVALQWSGRDLSFAWMTQQLPQFGPAITDLPSLARAMGIETTAFAKGLTPQRVSCGVPFLIVALERRADVDAVALERRALAECCRAAGMHELPVYFFSLEAAAGVETVYSRMLAPGFGISEDPATGSASGPLGAYLVQQRVLTPSEARHIVNAQGVAMGRPSRIYISIEGAPDAITAVKVGGTAVMVGAGELRL
jgi:trans-2,3-dihydro-3-hydroxyanthranilate isomerase